MAIPETVCVLPCHRVNTNSCHLACTRVPHSPAVLLTFVFCSVSVEPTSTTLSMLHWRCIHILVKLFRSQWWRSFARWRKGAAFTAKMNAGFDDDEFTAVDVESRGSEPNKQSNDPPPEFTGTKPSEFKSYRKNVKLWLLFARTPAQLQGPRVLSRLTGPAWDACDGLEPEDVAKAHGVKRDPGYTGRSFSRVNMRRNSSMPWRTLSMDLAGRRVRGSTTMHFGYRATYERLRSKEYDCQTKYRDFFCCVGRT